MSAGQFTQEKTALFALVDALHLKLSLKDGVARGAARITQRCGPLELTFPIRAKSDVYGDGVAAVLVHLRGHLWAYLLSTAPVFNVWMVLFNGDTLDFKDLSKGTVKATLDGIDKFIVATHMYQGNGVWKPCKKEDLFVP